MSHTKFVEEGKAASMGAGVTRTPDAVAEADLPAADPGAIRFVCPSCGATHDRGPVDGVYSFRCMKCGYIGRLMPARADAGPDRFTADPVPLLQLVGAMVAYLYDTEIVVRSGRTWGRRTKFMLEDWFHWVSWKANKEHCYSGATRGDALRELWYDVVRKMRGRVAALDDSHDLCDKAPFEKLAFDAESAGFTVAPVSIEHIAAAMLAIIHGASIEVTRRPTPWGYELHVSCKGRPMNVQFDHAGNAKPGWQCQGATRSDAIRQFWNFSSARVAELMGKQP